MKIVEAKIPQKKAAKFRDVIRNISGKGKAAVLVSDNDFRYFCKLAREKGLKPVSKKLPRGGWQVWC